MLGLARWLQPPAGAPAHRHVQAGGVFSLTKRTDMKLALDLLVLAAAIVVAVLSLPVS